MHIDYRDHLPAEFRIPAVCLYMHALRNKLLPVLGREDKAHQVFAKNLALDHCLTAFYNQKLIGILGIQTKEGGFWNPTLKSLIDEYRLMGGLYRFGGLYFLHHEAGVDEWYIDGIAVMEEMRGLGIGSGLLGLLEDIAKEKGVRKLSLEVVDTNQRARVLYERKGFVETERKTLWPFNHIYNFPFKSVFQMVKRLSGPETKIMAGNSSLRVRSEINSRS